MELPSPALLKAYETLTVVGILLLVLVVFTTLVVAASVWAGSNVSRFVKDFAAKHLAEMQNQTHAMIRIETKQDHMIQTQDAWNSYLFCWLPACPIKNLKRQPHENRVQIQDHPVQPADRDVGPGAGGI